MDENVEMDYVYIPKSIAKQLKDLDNADEQEKIVKKIIDKKKLDMEYENELLEDSLLQFKHVCLKHKIELQKVYDDQEKKLYDMWESMGDVRSKISANAKDLCKEINIISSEVSSLNRSVTTLKSNIGNLNLYAADKFASVIRLVHDMNDGTKAMLKSFFENFKKE